VLKRKEIEVKKSVTGIDANGGGGIFLAQSALQAWALSG
jgi:hypothetical protein